MTIHKYGFMITILLWFLKIYPEFLLYKVDPSNDEVMLPVQYNDASTSETEKALILHVYMNTIRKWAPPFCFIFAQEGEVIDAEFDACLAQKNGLLKFLDKKAKEISNNTYGVSWIPTTLYELYALKLLCLPANRSFYNNIYPVIAGREIVLSFGQVNARETGTPQVIELRDYLGREFATNRDAYGESIRKIFFALNDVCLEKRHEEIMLDTDIPSISSSTYPIYDRSWQNLLILYIEYEKDALDNNILLLSRGTRGYRMRDGTEYIDFEMGSIDGLSYGYSLFAGSFFERYMSDTQLGARSLDYIMKSVVGYCIFLPIKKAFSQKILELPYISTLEGLFGLGEYFHPRIKRDTNVSIEEKVEMITMLQHAHLLKYKNLTLDELKAKEIDLQKTQKKRADSLIDSLEFFQKDIIPLIRVNRKPLPVYARSILERCPPELYYLFPVDYVKHITLPELVSNHRNFSKGQKRFIIEQHNDISALPTFLFLDILYVLSDLKQEQVRSLSTEQIIDLLNYFDSYKYFQDVMHLMSREQFMSIDRTKILRPVVYESLSKKLGIDTQ